MTDPRRALAEARVALEEAALEVPDGDLEAMKRVIAGAIKRRALPLDAKDWWVKDGAPKQRRAADRTARGTEPPPPAPTPQGPDSPVVSRRTGRVIPATNTFVQQARGASPARPSRRSGATGRDGDAEGFPDFGDPTPAATDVGHPSDDRVLSRSFAGGDDDDSIDVPEPGGGRQVRTIKPASKPRKGGSIAGLFKRRPPDGRKQLDRALRDADRDARRKSGKQGMLGRLVRGRDVTR